MANKPLPPHRGPTVNVIEDIFMDQSTADVKNMKTPLKELHVRLVKSCLIEKKHDDYFECATQMKGFLVVQKDVQ